MIGLVVDHTDHSDLSRGKHMSASARRPCPGTGIAQLVSPIATDREATDLEARQGERDLARAEIRLFADEVHRQRRLLQQSEDRALFFVEGNGFGKGFVVGRDTPDEAGGKGRR